MTNLTRLTKPELIKVAEYCHTLEHVADILLQVFNKAPDATNHIAFQFKRQNTKTGETEDFELMLRRTMGEATLELLTGLTKKYRELEAQYAELQAAHEAPKQAAAPTEEVVGGGL